MTRKPVEWALRLGCGFVNLYAGFYLITDPARYHKFVPWWLNRIATSIASVDAYLRLQGTGELLIASVLLGWFFPKMGGAGCCHNARNRNVANFDFCRRRFCNLPQCRPTWRRFCSDARDVCHGNLRNTESRARFAICTASGLSGSFIYTGAVSGFC